MTHTNNEIEHIVTYVQDYLVQQGILQYEQANTTAIIANKLSVINDIESTEYELT